MSDKDFNIIKLFGNAHRLIDVYHQTLQPLCSETGIPLMALDILLFVANNPENAIANDICRIRGLKPGIVSVHVDRLVNCGLLRRESVQGDRRKTRLVCTEKAEPVVEKGREYQQLFSSRLLTGLNGSDIAAFRSVLSVINENIDDIRRNGI